MPKYFIIRDGRIENTIEHHEPFTSPGAEVIPADGVVGENGWEWKNGAAIPPVEIVAPKPNVLTSSQFHAMVDLLGLTDALRQKIQEMPQPQRGAAWGKVYHSTSFRRDHPLTETLRQRMGLTKQEFDAAWEQAKSLEA